MLPAAASGFAWAMSYASTAPPAATIFALAAALTLSPLTVYALPTSPLARSLAGPFDALAIGGVAVLSNRISLQQAEIIDDLDREVIVVPDADRAGAALIDAAIEYGWSVSYPVWQKDYKDINAATVALGPLFVLKSILAARVRGRLKIELHKKRLYN